MILLSCIELDKYELEKGEDDEKKNFCSRSFFNCYGTDLRHNKGEKQGSGLIGSANVCGIPRTLEESHGKQKENEIC